METTPNKYITVAYELYTDFDGKRELVEKAPAEHPFQFISGLGTTLDAFEAQIIPLARGDKFDFTLSVDEAYGPYEQERVIELSKDTFKVNGHFDKERIYPGAVVPLMNADGARFNGTIAEVTETTVTVDLNHPLAGKALNFVGEVTENREATKDEIQGMLNMLSGEGGCSCGCGGCGGDCDDECGCGGHDDGGCGCGHCH
ncbi:MAG: FKBP-type peptidyl-prolyl cis-trans isomerase [Paraprevotella sp.]|nr:FKBP-type peptidyl-prolyl cis-trans isomerase [Paraprevotella sp.]